LDGKNNMTTHAMGSISPPVPKTLSYKIFFHIILIITAISICYSNTLHQEWHFDDNSNIVKSKALHLKEITTQNIIKTFYSNQDDARNKLYRPIPCLSFALNYYFTGLKPFSYHFVNICIHIIAAIFVYLIFFEILLILKNRDSLLISADLCQGIALLGAFMWALHPIQTQAVTYVVQRMASMAAMFYFIAFYFYILFRQKKGRIKKTLYILTASICFMAALLSKENTVMFPLAIILFEFVFFPHTPVKKKYILLCLLFFVIISSLAFIFFRSDNIIVKILSHYSHRPFTMWERLLTEPRIIIRYILLMLYPVSDFLSHESHIIHSTGLLKPLSTSFSILFILSLLTGSIIYLKRFKLICFAILFYFINHLIESSFIGLELYFEHRNYLPSIFIYLAIAFYLIQWVLSYKQHNKKIMHFLIMLFITAIIVSEGNATYLRNDIWQTEETLLTDAIKKAPDNIRPRISLAAFYINSKENDKALNLLKEAEQIYKANKELVQKNWVGDLYYNAGILKMNMGEDDKAERYYMESLKHDPVEWMTYVNLGYLFFKKNDLENAHIAFNNALKINNTNPDLFVRLARVLYEKGNAKEALETYHKAFEMEETIATQINIVGCYLKSGDIASAKKEFYAIKLKGNPGAIYYIYKAILFDGKTRENTIHKVSEMLFINRIDFCKWISDIKENKTLGMIYPDISLIEDELTKSYISSLNTANRQFGANIQKIKECSRISDQQI